MYYVMDWSDDLLSQEVIIAGPFDRSTAIQVLCVVGSWISKMWWLYITTSNTYINSNVTIGLIRLKPLITSSYIRVNICVRCSYIEEPFIGGML